jgi:hypothetical protein
MLYGIRLLEFMRAVSYWHPPNLGGSGLKEGRDGFVSEYAERGEWFVVAFGEGSLDSNEKFLAC